MKKVLIYFLSLTVASVVVFLLFFTVGRRSSLEQELARRSTIREQPEGALVIDSLKPAEEEEEGEDVEELPPPEVHQLSETFTLTRSVVREAGLALLVDGEALLDGASSGPPTHFRRGLESFFARLPANLLLSMRGLAGGLDGDCGSSAELVTLAAHTPAALTGAFGRIDPAGPRSIARALEEAASDLTPVEGEKAVVVLTGGDEGCGGAPCRISAELQQAYGPLRVHVIVLRPPREYSSYGGELPPPAWMSRMECIAQRGEGTFTVASTPDELQAALQAVVSSLQPNVAVRFRQSAEREVTGAGAERQGTWGIEVRRSGEKGELLATGGSLPALFSLPVGDYDFRFRYQGQERSLDGLKVRPLEALEVDVNFRSGELYVQAKDSAGEELAGDTTDINCLWGVEVFRADDLGRDFGASCSFPAYFVLEPGTYTIRTWNGPQDLWHEGIKVAEGETTLRSPVFKAKEP